MDVFAWTHSYMAGINLSHVSHKLNIIPSAWSVRQKVRRFHSNRYQVIQAEVVNRLKEGFIREIKYPEWLANVVVVPKKAVNREYAWTTHISIRHARKTASFYLG